MALGVNKSCQWQVFSNKWGVVLTTTGEKVKWNWTAPLGSNPNAKRDYWKQFSLQTKRLSKERLCVYWRRETDSNRRSFWDATFPRWYIRPLWHLSMYWVSILNFYIESIFNISQKEQNCKCNLYLKKKRYFYKIKALIRLIYTSCVIFY